MVHIPRVLTNVYWNVSTIVASYQILSLSTKSFCHFENNKIGFTYGETVFTFFQYFSGIQGILLNHQEHFLLACIITHVLLILIEHPTMAKMMWEGDHLIISRILPLRKLRELISLHTLRKLRCLLWGCHQAGTNQVMTLWPNPVMWPWQSTFPPCRQPSQPSYQDRVVIICSHVSMINLSVSVGSHHTRPQGGEIPKLASLEKQVKCPFCCFKRVNPGCALCFQDWQGWGRVAGRGQWEHMRERAPVPHQSLVGVWDELSHAMHNPREVTKMAKESRGQWGCRLGVTLSMTKALVALRVVS